MKILKPHYYDQFSCIGGSCSDTCCAGWDITVDEKTLEYYKSTSGEIGENLRNSIEEKDDGKTIFILDKDFCCPFLNAKKLCDIIIILGSDKLCNTCKIYPRIVLRYDDIIEYNLTLSCPEVARILTTFETIEFCLDDIEINEGIENEACNDFLFNSLIQARGMSVDIMQMREIPIWKRTILCVSIAEKLQACIEKDEYSNFNTILNQYSNEEFINNYISSLDSLPQSILLKYEQYKEILKITFKMNIINHKFNDLVNEIVNFINNNIDDNLQDIISAFEKHNSDKDYIFENYAVYHLFRYYMNAYKSKDIYQHIVLLVDGLALIKLMSAIHWFLNGNNITDNDFRDILYSYSRAFEHSTFINQMYNRMKEKGYDNMAYLAALIH